MQVFNSIIALIFNLDVSYKFSLRYFVSPFLILIFAAFDLKTLIIVDIFLTNFIHQMLIANAYVRKKISVLTESRNTDK